MSPTADEPISVTVDVSDLSLASAEPLRSIISRYGRPVTARAFADFQQSGLSDLAVQFYQMGFTLVHCPTWPNGEGFPKSVVSDVMAQDLRDQLEQHEDVETFVVVATSRDYIAVTNALRRHDRRVVVVAEEAKVCRELRTCADEFAVLPPTRPERSSDTARHARTVDVARVERSAETGRFERIAEVRPDRAAEVRPERVAEVPRFERPAEPIRPERLPEPVRQERAPEPVRQERAPEPVRQERAPEPPRVEKTETQEQVRLPSDAEVLGEVRRIVAAEGICTPRRLARALCPVDRTATGELRSRIANRIQTLIEAGKLQRERLVVGGTSVETILAREERNGRGGHVAPQEAAQPPVAPAPLAAPAKEPEPLDPYEMLGLDGMIQGEPIATDVVAETPVVEPESEPVREVESVAREGESPTRDGESFARDLDALVESVLRSPELAADLLRREPTPEPEPPVLSEEPVHPAPEPPRRSRSRRRTPAKAPAPEPNGTV